VFTGQNCETVLALIIQVVDYNGDSIKYMENQSSNFVCLQVWHFEDYDQTILNVFASSQYILWLIGPLLSSDSVKSGRC
jgi:hypothetical protein